jgi:integrase/recombinase XerD
VRRLAGAAGVADRCSPHILRHSFARAFLANGGDVFTLQRILGHSPSSLQVTRRYVRLLDEDIRAAHRRASPLDRL